MTEIFMNSRLLSRCNTKIETVMVVCVCVSVSVSVKLKWNSVVTKELV